MAHGKDTTSVSAGASQLAELLACERELAELLKAARDESARRIRDARASAAREMADLEVTLEGAALAIRSGIREEAQARVHEVLQGGRERAARHRAVPDAEIDRLAGLAFAILILPGAQA